MISPAAKYCTARPVASQTAEQRVLHFPKTRLAWVRKIERIDREFLVLVLGVALSHRAIIYTCRPGRIPFEGLKGTLRICRPEY